MMMLVNCSQCGTPLQLPANVRSIRCAICNAVTNIADPRSLPPPLPSSWSAAPPPPPAATFGLSNYAPAPPSAHGRKKAVICGISYRNSRHELKGCINDSKCMKYLLMNRFHFPESSIIMLTEEETDPFKRPTKQNMRMAIYWLVQGCQPGDSLVFHYSGHGSQQRNYNGDEVDGYDETLLPLDFETQGMIVDDEINETLVRPLPRGARLHALIDACHSGTVLDLPYLCRMDRTGRYAWEDHRPPSGVWKGTSGGEAISISGCDDNQTSADTSHLILWSVPFGSTCRGGTNSHKLDIKGAVVDGTPLRTCPTLLHGDAYMPTKALSRITSTGAMTFCFIQAIERGAGTTYGNLLNAMRTTIRSANVGGGGGPVVSLLTMLLNGDSGAGGLTQEPQLTSNEMFDVYSKPFYI